ncbi:MAG: hypothetical protein HQK59_10035 [Deltaproteobacteria bacterium]|nr:hypothetical protein [Deltaproteobacteria bacterium]
MATVSLQINLELEDYLVKGSNLEERQRLIREDIIIGDYLNGNLDIGTLTKTLDLGFDDTIKWLESKGVPLLRRLPPELEKAVQKNMQDLAAGKLPHLHFDPWENHQLLMEGEVCFLEKMKDPEFRKAMEEDEIRPEIEKEARQAIKERLIVHEYVHGDISIGSVGEMLGLRYVEGRHWLAGQSIATIRSLPPELEEIADRNMRKFAKELGITIPQPL